MATVKGVGSKSKKGNRNIKGGGVAFSDLKILKKSLQWTTKATTYVKHSISNI